jgi:hypothetical protein
MLRGEGCLVPRHCGTRHYHLSSWCNSLGFATWAFQPHRKTLGSPPGRPSLLQLHPCLQFQLPAGVDCAAAYGPHTRHPHHPAMHQVCPLCTHQSSRLSSSCSRLGHCTCPWPPPCSQSGVHCLGANALQLVCICHMSAVCWGRYSHSHGTSGNRATLPGWVEHCAFKGTGVCAMGS